MPIDYQEHADEVTKLVRDMTDYYLRTYPGTDKVAEEDVGILRPNNAVPKKFGPLMDYLQVLTDEADAAAKAAADETWWPAGWLAESQADLDDWHTRLLKYQLMYRAGMRNYPDSQSEAWIYQVTDPLLVGWYPDPDQKVQGPPDLNTPLQIAFALRVGKQNMDEAWAQFWKDIRDALPTDPAKTLGNMMWLLVGGAAIGLAAWGIGKGRKTNGN